MTRAAETNMKAVSAPLIAGAAAVVADAEVAASSAFAPKGVAAQAASASPATATQRLPVRNIVVRLRAGRQPAARASPLEPGLSIRASAAHPAVVRARRPRAKRSRPRRN